MSRYLDVAGILQIPTNMDEDVFWHLFIDFLESQDCQFAGGIHEADENGNPLETED